MKNSQSEENPSLHTHQELLKNNTVGGNLSTGDITQQIVETQIINNIVKERSPDNACIELQTWLNQEMQRSRARCIERWQGSGVSERDAIALFEDVAIGASSPKIELLPGKLILLVGEMGSGKSLVAERLFQAAIQEAQQDQCAPIPIYFESDIESLELAIQATTQKLCHLTTSKILVIIDSPDEAGISRANKLLKDARILVQSQKNITIVITGRPILQFAEAEEAKKISLLSESDSLQLVNRLSGKQVYGVPHQLSESVRDAIRRPLFAILLGVYLKKRAKLPSSKEQLLANLIERSLEPMNENIIKVREELEFLAVYSINNGGSTVPANRIGFWSERQILLDSRLVVQYENGLKFPLPALTQWFAAQALNSGKISVEELVGDLEKLELWQYPLVIATGILNSDRVTEILTPIVEQHPFIAAEIVREALSNQFRVVYRTRDFSMPSALETGHRVRHAMRAWCKGLGQLGQLISPVDRNGHLAPLGVCVKEKLLETDPHTETEEKTIWINLVWCFGSQSEKDVVVLPPHVDVKDSELGKASYINSCEFWLHEHPSWHWYKTHEDVVGFLSDLLSRRGFPTFDSALENEFSWQEFPPMTQWFPPQSISFTPGWRQHRLSNKGSALVREGAWYAAFFLTRNYSSDNVNIDPIPLEQIISLLNQIHYYHDALKKGVDPLRLNQLTLEVNRLLEMGEVYLYYPWTHSFTKSHQELLKHAIEVYESALHEYQQIVKKWFLNYIPWLETAARLPARIKGVFVPYDSQVSSRGLSWYWEALPPGSES